MLLVKMSRGGGGGGGGGGARWQSGNTLAFHL